MHNSPFCVIDAELLVLEFSTCGDADLCWHACFRCENTGWLSTFFVPVTLTLTQWPSYMKLIRTRMCRHELPTSRISKVIVWHTDRQTDTTEIINHVALPVISNKNNWQKKTNKEEEEEEEKQEAELFSIIGIICHQPLPIPPLWNNLQTHWHEQT